MTSCWRSLLAFLSLSAILIAGTGARPPAQSQITINYPSITGPTWPLYVARQGGYYAKYGLDVNLVFGEHPAGIAMIVSDEADMTNYALELAMQASSRDGSLVAYGSPFKKSLYALMAGKEIRRIRASNRTSRTVQNPISGSAPVVLTVLRFELICRGPIQEESASSPMSNGPETIQPSVGRPQRGWTSTEFRATTIPTCAVT